MKQYLDLLQNIMENGCNKGDRTGTGTKSIFGTQMRFNLQEGFPLVTTKKIHFKSIVHELLWIISGDTNIKYLKDNNVKIWNEWQKPVHNVGENFEARPFIWVEPIIKKYVGYNGDFSTNGLGASRGSLEDNLRNAWVKMMKRCYQPNHHRYHMYGGKKICVCKRWHDVGNFIKDVKELPNWDFKLQNWSEYELDKDYYSSNIYSKETCVWLHTAENNFYTSASFPVEVTDCYGKSRTHITLNKASESEGITLGSLSRFVNNGMPSTLKQGNKKFEGWTFKKLTKKDKKMRYAFSFGDLGPVYGHQWRRWGKFHETEYANIDEGGCLFEKSEIDQLQVLIERIKSNPECRRLIVTAWNPADLPEMALAPCHCFFQFNCRPLDVEQREALCTIGQEPDHAECWGDDDHHEHMDKHNIPKYYLDCQLYQRSCDTFLGVPFNIASYSLLTHMIAQTTNMVAGDFIWTGGDTHIYDNHHDQVNLQLTKEPYPLPQIKLNPDIKDIDDFKFEDIELVGYKSRPTIKAPVAV